MAPDDHPRMDKWLWAVRIFKTRALAAEACRLGRVSIAGAAVKAGRNVNINDVITIRAEGATRVFKALGLPPRRLGAAEAKRHVEDQTPPEELERQRQVRLDAALHRPKGAGRPTKRERRIWDKFAGH